MSETSRFHPDPADQAESCPTCESERFEPVLSFFREQYWCGSCESLKNLGPSRLADADGD
jgi:hypothetical protein